MVAVDDGKTRGERWNGRDKHAPREKGGGEGGGGEGGGGGVTYKSSASRVACNYVCTSLREARGGFAVGCASFLSAATTSSCACVCIIHPPVLFIFFPFSFSFLHPTRPRFTVRFGHRSLGDGNILLGSPFAVGEWHHF